MWQNRALESGLSEQLQTTWEAFQGEHYHFGNYLSLFYLPEIFGDSPHSDPIRNVFRMFGSR